MTKPAKNTTPPAMLIAGFRALETPSQIAVLLAEDDGFDALTLRVLGAWQSTAHRWTEPSSPCPTPIPTPESWDWLRSGWTIDLDAIAKGAAVTRETAREKIDVLIGNRLIYPTGDVHTYAAAALKKLVVQRLGLKSKGKGKKRSDDGDGDSDSN